MSPGAVAMGRSSPYLEGEGVGVLAELLHQLLLQRGEGFGHLVGHRREDLRGQDVEVLPEGQPDNVEVVPAVAEGASQRHVNWGRRGGAGRARRRGKGLGKEGGKRSRVYISLALKACYLQQCDRVKDLAPSTELTRSIASFFKARATSELLSLPLSTFSVLQVLRVDQADAICK